MIPTILVALALATLQPSTGPLCQSGDMDGFLCVPAPVSFTCGEPGLCINQCYDNCSDCWEQCWEECSGVWGCFARCFIASPVGDCQQQCETTHGHI